MPSTKEKTTNLSMMIYVPLQPAWLTHLPSFQSTDARIVRGCLNMLMAAFHGQPAGTLPDTDEALATAAQLPLEVVRKYRALLTHGWKMDKKGLVFTPMFDLAARLSNEYSDALNRLQDATLIAMQAPDLFNSELLPEQGEILAKNVGDAMRMKIDALKDTKVKRSLPEGAPLTPSLANFLQKQGFSIGLHEEIWQLFTDYHRSQRTTSASWSSEFRRWVMNQILYGKLVPCTGNLPAVFKNSMSIGQTSNTTKTFSFSRNNAQNFNFAARGDAIENHATQKLAAAQNAVLSMRQAQSAQYANRQANA